MSSSPPTESLEHDRDGRADSDQERGPGAPKGNLNAMKHGAYLNERKRDAKARRDKYRRRGEREARAILSSRGLGDDPLAKLVARQIGRLEAMAHRLEAWHDTRGYFTAAGDLKNSVGKEIEVIGRLLDETRKILDHMRSKNGPGGDNSLAEIIASSYQIEAADYKHRD